MLNKFLQGSYMNKKQLDIQLILTTVLLLLLTQNGALAGATTISGITSNLTSAFSDIAKIITAAAYIAGLGFAFAAILKFKAHRDNPTQITIGTPLALLFIAAALLFLPMVFSVAGSTIFGSGSTQGGISGTTSLPGF